MTQRETKAGFPTAAGILFGLGLGGFFDGIVLHQILQWHHMLTSAGWPADNVHDLKVNTLWDGIFHASTYVFVVAGLVVLWRRAQRTHLWWSGRMLVGSMLLGFGIFNVVEGIIDHQILGLHHVNETVPRAVDLVGPGLPALGRRHDRRRLVAAEIRRAQDGRRRRGQAMM